jgi:hypothetical protein
MVEGGNGGLRRPDGRGPVRKPLFRDGSSPLRGINDLPPPTTPGIRSSVEYATYLDMQARNVPEALRIALNELDRVWSPDDRPDTVIRTRLADATLQPRGSTELNETWKLLRKTAASRRYPLAKRVAATLVADALHYQTGLPYTMKKHSGGDIRRPTAEDQARLRAADLVQDTERPTRKFYTPLAERADARKAAKGPDLGALQSVKDALAANYTHERDIVRQVTVIDDMVRMRRGSLYKFCEEINRPDESALVDFNTMMQQDTQQVLTKPQVAALLLKGKLENADMLEVRYPIWRAEAVQRGIVAPDSSSDRTASVQRNTDAAVYFIQHPDLQTAFWKDFVQVQPDGTVDNGNLRYAENIVLEAPNVVPQLLGNIAIETFPAQQKRTLIRQLTTVVARAHTISRTENSSRITESLPDLRAQLNTLAQRANMSGMIAEELAILRNEAPGAITRNNTYEARARTTDTRSDASELYRSTMDFPTVEVRETVDTRLHIVSGQTEVFPAWHGREAQTPSDEDMPTLLMHMDAHMERAGLTAKKLESYAWPLRDRPVYRGKGAAVIPELLPITHPLHDLHKVGIAAIEPTGKDFGFQVVIDAKKAGVAVEGGQLLIIDGIVDPSSREVLLSGLDDATTNTTIVQAIGEGAFMTRHARQSRSLHGQDVSEVRTRVKAWNQGGNVPTLSYTESVHPEADTVLFPINGKTILLNIIPENEK